MTQPPGYQSGMDPKAQAKAEKAYAKATRPWYKKKRFIIPLALLVIILLSTALGGGGESDETAEDTSSESSSSSGEKKSDKKSDEKSDVGSKANPAPPGTAVKNKSASYRLDDVEIIDGELASGIIDAPTGKYVLLTVTVKNVKDETIQVSSEDFKLAVDGKQFEADSDGIFLDDGFNYDDLSPELERTGKVLFELPENLAGEGVLIAQAMFSSDKAVHLSLTK